MYHYQEGVSGKNSVFYSGGAFVQVVRALHQSGIAQHPHPEVMMLYLDISVRYAKILGGKEAGRERRDSSNNVDFNAINANQQVLEVSQELKEQMIMSVLDCVGAGLGHGEKNIRSRTCYLLVRFVKAMGDGLACLMDRAVGGIQGLLSANRVANYTLISVDDGNYLFEAIGQLINMESLSTEAKADQLSNFVMPQVLSIKEVLADPGTTPSSSAAITVSVLIGTIANLSKGFKSKDRFSPEMSAIFGHALNTTMAALFALPSDLVIRAKSMVLIHRMIFLLEEETVLSYLPMFLNLLVTNCVEDDLPEVVSLMNQILVKFQGKVFTAVDGILQPFLRHCMELAPDTASGQGSSSQIKVQAMSVKKLYMLFLSFLVTNGCTNVLVSSTNKGMFPNVLNAMVDGLFLPDFAVNKTALLFFIKICQFDFSIGVDGCAECYGMYWQFIVDNVMTSVIRMMTDKRFNIKDAMCSRVVGEVASLFHIVRDQKTAEFEAFVKALAEYSGAKCGESTEKFVVSGSEGEMKAAIMQFLKAL